MNRKLTTNSRLVNELFANYISTFTAFCELINNSIQAKANNVWIDIDYTDNSEIHPTIISQITIKDDGIGVHRNELEKKLLDIGTTNKVGGKGIGRFASFQLGKSVMIETVGFSSSKNNYSKVQIPLHFDMFGKNLNVSEIDIDSKEETLSGKKYNTYYKVEISEFYTFLITDWKKRKN